MAKGTWGSFFQTMTKPFRQQKKQQPTKSTWGSFFQTMAEPFGQPTQSQMETEKTPVPETPSRSDMAVSSRLSVAPDVEQPAAQPAPSQTTDQQRKAEKIKEELLDIKGELEGMQETLQGREGEDVVSTEDMADDEDIDPSNVKKPLDGGDERLDGGDVRADQTFGKIDSWDDIQEWVTQQLSDVTTKKSAAEASRQEWMQQLQQQVQQTPKMSKVATTMQEDMNVMETYQDMVDMKTEIEPIDDKISELRQEKARKLGESEAAGMSATYIRGEKSRIQRQYNSQIAALQQQKSAKAAQIEAMQGNIQTARNLINDTVNYMTYDIDRNRQDIQMFTDYYSDYIDNLDQERRDYLNSVESYWEKMSEWAREDYRDKMTLIADAATNGVNLGLSTDDVRNMDYAEIAQIYSEQVSAATAAQDATTVQITGVNEKGEATSQTLDLTKPEHISVFASQTGRTEGEMMAYLNKATDLDNKFITQLVGEAFGIEADQGEINRIKTDLSNMAGSDGYVHPDDWKRARQVWVNSGHSEAAFVQKFHEFINPRDLPHTSYTNVERNFMDDFLKAGKYKLTKENIGKIFSKKMLKRAARENDYTSWRGTPKVDEYLNKQLMPRIRMMQDEGMSADAIVGKLSDEYKIEKEE